MHTLDLQWAGLTADIERLDRITAIAKGVRQYGMSYDAMVSLESIEPGILLRDIPSTEFTIDPSDVRLQVSLERIDFLKVGLIGGILAALIAYLVKLFRGRTANKNHEKDVKNATQEATNSAEEFDEAREEAAEATQNTSTTLTRDELKDLYHHLIKIGVDDADARKWTATTHTVRDYFFHSKTYRDDILTYAMDKCCYPILLADDYLASQDELRNVISAILPEAPNRVAYIEQLAAYSRLLYDTQNLFIDDHENDQIPEFNADIGKIRLYTGAVGDTTRGVAPIVDDFNGKIGQLFTPMQAPGRLLLSPLLVEERYTDVLRDAVKMSIEYEDYYITKGVKALEKLSGYLSELERAMKDKTSIDSQRERVFDLYDVVRDELKATARIASTMIMVRERSERIVGVLQKAATTLTTARELIERLRKQLKISKYYSNESLEPHAETNPDVVLEPDDGDLALLLEQADSLESIHNELAYKQVINQAEAARINTICATPVLTVGDFTPQMSKLGVQPALESIKSFLEKAIRGIIDFIGRCIKRLINWFQGTSSEDAASVRKERVIKAFKTFTARHEMTLRLIDETMESEGIKPIAAVLETYRTKGGFPEVRGTHPVAVLELLYKGMASEPVNRVNRMTLDIVDGKLHTRTAVELTTHIAATSLPRLTQHIKHLTNGTPLDGLDLKADITALTTYVDGMYNAIKLRPGNVTGDGFKLVAEHVRDIQTRLNMARTEDATIVLDPTWLTKVHMDTYFGLLVDTKGMLGQLKEANTALDALRKANTSNTLEFKACLEKLVVFAGVVTKLTMIIRDIRASATAFLKSNDRISEFLINVGILAHAQACPGVTGTILRKEARVLARSLNLTL